MALAAVSIRDAAPADLEAIAAIYGESVRTGVASYELEPPQLDEMRRRYAAVIAGRYSYLVAQIDGKIAGYAYASAFRPRPAYRYLVEDSIYIDERWRGRGIGTHLLGELIERCETQGLRQMVAVIGGAAPASIALHRKAGFRTVGRIEASGYKFGRWLDTLFMQRALGTGASDQPED